MLERGFFVKTNLDPTEHPVYKAFYNYVQLCDPGTQLAEAAAQLRALQQAKQTADQVMASMPVPKEGPSA